eukprot:2613083-Amphidinium_carterae.1
MFRVFPCEHAGDAGDGVGALCAAILDRLGSYWSSNRWLHLSHLQPLPRQRMLWTSGRNSLKATRFESTTESLIQASEEQRDAEARLIQESL